MDTKLNTKKTKYAKAIERITGKPAIVYHALKFRDLSAVEHSLDSPIVTKVKLFEKYNTTTDDIKKNIVMFIDKISEACYEAKGLDFPEVPLRTQIQENINILQKF